VNVRTLLILAAVSLGLGSAANGQDNQLHNLPPTEKPRFAITDRDWPRDPGQASICLWKDDKLAAASITIDDNNAPDQPWWLTQGDKYGFKFTWFVISGRVGTGNQWGTWETFQQLREKGHDVQSHTTTHFNPDVKRNQETEAIYKEAIDDIEKGVPGDKVLTLAYPGGPNAKNDVALAAKYYTACRGTRGVLNAANTVNYIETNSVGNGLPTDGKNWATVQFLTDPKSKYFRGWGCMHFHGLENPKEPEKAAKVTGEKILQYLADHKDEFWVGTFTEVTSYGQERDTAKLTTKRDGKAIKLSITDQMDDSLFTTPLTVKLRLDPSWGNVTAKQGNTAVEVQVIEKNGAKFALVQVIPDKGEMTVSP
jgi:peptidoglycan/xylan/chitin deacetylase (PgdA/CDA1 family)